VDGVLHRGGCLISVNLTLRPQLVAPDKPGKCSVLETTGDKCAEFALERDEESRITLRVSVERRQGCSRTDTRSFGFLDTDIIDSSDARMQIEHIQFSPSCRFNLFMINSLQVLR